MTAGAGPGLTPRRAPLALLIALLIAVPIVFASCNSTAATPAPTATPPAPSASESTAPSDASTGPVVPDSPVAGLVVAVDSAGLDAVKGFTLQTNDGVTIVFTLGTLENGAEFPPGHLKEHQASAAPVLVFFRQSNGQLVVYRTEDAG